MNHKPLQVCCVTDGKPGHRTQLAGLAQALADLLLVELHWLEPGAHRPASQPDLILAAGHGTHWRALRLKWSSGARLVVLMKPGLPRGLFNLCVIPEHDGVAPSRRVLVTRGMLNDIRPGEAADPGAGLILVGGPSAHHGWDEPGLLAQVARLRELLPDMLWTLTTSRRTPVPTGTALAALAGPQLACVPFADTDRAWLRAQLQRCAIAWVTEDSASMVYEALTAGARVGVLAVPRSRPSRVSRGLDALLASGEVATLDTLAATGAMPAPARTLDEAARVAQYVARWFEPGPRADNDNESPAGPAQS